MGEVKAKCTQCGAIIEVDEYKEATICGICGEAFVVEKAINNFKGCLISQNNGMLDKNLKDFEIVGGVLIKYNGESLDVIIPSNVKAIGTSVFKNTYIESVRMTSVIEIRDEAFLNCRNLQEIIFSPILKKIGARAFETCITLEKIEFPDSLEEITQAAFKNCTNLQFSSLPEKLKLLGQDVFSGCKNIRKIVFPEAYDFSASHLVLGGLSYQSNDFSDCFFEEVILPRNLKTLPSGLFRNCKNLKYVKLPDNLEIIPQAIFLGCSNLKSVELPETVNLISRAAFKDSGIENITIPNNVKKIESEAFYRTNLEMIEIPDNCFVEGKCYDSEWGTIESYGAFYNCKQLQKAIKPKTATIGPDAFETNVIIQRKRSSGGCYIATCIYGTYDCPQVWTLRRFRDYFLDKTWYGRVFIRCYYLISPILVKRFGQTKWFKIFWKSKLDKIVKSLNDKGVDNIEYYDKY